MSLLFSETLTADGNTSEYIIRNPRNSSNIYQTLVASGNYGGGTLTPQISNDGTNWIDVTDISGSVEFTAPSSTNLFLLSGGKRSGSDVLKFRCNLSGATSPNIKITFYDTK
jgi:hypothetical protein